MYESEALEDRNQYFLKLQDKKTQLNLLCMEQDRLENTIEGMEEDVDYWKEVYAREKFKCDVLVRNRKGLLSKISEIQPRATEKMIYDRVYMLVAAEGDERLLHLIMEQAKLYFDPDVDIDLELVKETWEDVFSGLMPSLPNLGGFDNFCTLMDRLRQPFLHVQVEPDIN